jgi:hypothetical protein
MLLVAGAVAVVVLLVAAATVDGVVEEVALACFLDLELDDPIVGREKRLIDS